MLWCADECDVVACCEVAVVNYGGYELEGLGVPRDNVGEKDGKGDFDE